MKVEVRIINCSFFSTKLVRPPLSTLRVVYELSGEWAEVVLARRNNKFLQAIAWREKFLVGWV